MTTYVHTPSRVFSHIHYINSYLCRHFLICGYVIFPSLCRTISYLRNMSAYDFCISVYFSFVSLLWRRFFLPFSFVYTLYPVLYPSVSTLYSIPSPPVFMLDSISSWFDPTLTTFPTVNYINTIVTMKSLTEPNCNLCMEEHLTILKNLRNKTSHL